MHINIKSTSIPNTYASTSTQMLRQRVTAKGNGASLRVCSGDSSCCLRPSRHVFGARVFLFVVLFPLLSFFRVVEVFWPILRKCAVALVEISAARSM